ncbi:coagulase domain-containing protein [Staphylococcus hyicus]|uniref:coagulase domain-containing protein n=1 Tax=Staphylococcus hyicus TaxID=1284 RepID=UPI0036D26779
MKKKLLVLSASAILASNFILDNNASAVVSKNDIKSDSWNVEGIIYPEITLERYLDSLDRLTNSLTVGHFSGYDQPEYQDAYQQYQKRFLAEIGAIVQFVIEDDRTYKYIRKYDNDNIQNKIGLTHQRYDKVYRNLERNKKIFEAEVRKIESENKDLQRFDEHEQKKANLEVNELENKVLMVAKAFSNHAEARDDLYNKLDMVMAYQVEEVGEKKYYTPQNIPTNHRMLRELKEDLETIIDEFFNATQLKRPLNIEPLSSKNEKDETVFNKLREDAKKASLDPKLVDPEVEKRAKRAEERLAKLTKNSKEAQELAAKTKSAIKILKAEKGQTEFSYKQLSQKAKNKLSIKYPDTNIQLPTYTESITQSPQPALKQQTREETFTLESAPRLNQSKPLNGLNGESHFVTMDESSNASTQFGSNGHVFEYSFDSTPKTTNVTKQNVKQENYNSVNNLAGMSGESQHVDFTQDSHPTTTYGGYGNAFDFTEDTAPKQPETITESHEIVFDEYTDVTVSGYTKGESIEDTNVPTQTNQKN